MGPAPAWKIAAKQPDFGRPDQFLRDISQSTMMTFTVTFRRGLFQRKFEWLVERQMGRQSPLPITVSPWILHLHTHHQPLFPDQPRDTCVIWVTALGGDNVGTFVKKTMPECTGREILEDLLGHLQFDQNEGEKNEILDTSTCIPCMLLYSTSQFLSRAKGDRPAVVPEGSRNFALLEQFVEIPDVIVFTTEYNVLCAIQAVKKFVKTVTGAAAGVFRAVPPAHVHCSCTCFGPLGVFSQPDNTGALADRNSAQFSSSLANRCPSERRILRHQARQSCTLISQRPQGQVATVRWRTDLSYSVTRTLFTERRGGQRAAAQDRRERRSRRPD